MKKILRFQSSVFKFNQLKLSIFLIFATVTFVNYYLSGITIFELLLYWYLLLVFMEIVRRFYRNSIIEKIDDRFEIFSNEQDRALNEMMKFNIQVSRSYFEARNKYKTLESKVINHILYFNNKLPLSDKFLNSISGQPLSAKKVLGLTDSFDGLPNQIVVLNCNALYAFSGLPEIHYSVGLILKSNNDPHAKYQNLYKIYDIFSKVVKKYDANSLIKLLNDITSNFDFSPISIIKFDDVIYFDFSEEGETHSVKNNSVNPNAILSGVSTRKTTNPVGPTDNGILKVSDSILINSMKPRRDTCLLEIATINNGIEEKHYFKKSGAQQIYNELLLKIPDKRAYL